MGTSDFEIVDGCYQIPVKAIVLMLASVYVFDDAENLTLAIYLFYCYSARGLLAVMFFLFFGEQVLLTCLEG